MLVMTSIAFINGQVIRHGVKHNSNMPTNAQIKSYCQLLAREGLHHGPIKTESMKGGLWNDALRVEAGEATYVFKTYCEVPEDAFFPNVAADEAKALQRLAKLEISPEFVGLWPDENLLVYKYVKGNTWSSDVAAVARLLVRKEVCDPTGFPLGKLTPHELLAEGDAIFARCRHAKPPARPTPIDIEPPARLSLIHRDIGPNNLVGEGEQLRLIDWQCPTAGDLSEDIYSFLAPSFHIVSEQEPLSNEQVAQFFQALNLHCNKARYERLAPFFSWRMAAYCSWRAETHNDPEIRERYRKAALAEFDFICN